MWAKKLSGGLKMEIVIYIIGGAGWLLALWSIIDAWGKFHACMDKYIGICEEELATQNHPLDVVSISP